MKQELFQLMNGKPANFVEKVKQSLNEKKEIVLENKLYIFSKELNEEFGGQLNEDEEKNAYFEGKQAFLDGKKLEDNPYEEGSEKADQWGRGFSIADKQIDIAKDGKLDEKVLNELSPKTLGSYTKKAIKDSTTRSIGIQNAGGFKTDHDGDATLFGSKDIAKKVIRKQENRNKYIDKAIGKLSDKATK